MMMKYSDVKALAKLSASALGRVQTYDFSDGGVIYRSEVAETNGFYALLSLAVSPQKRNAVAMSIGLGIYNDLAGGAYSKIVEMLGISLEGASNRGQPIVGFSISDAPFKSFLSMPLENEREIRALLHEYSSFGLGYAADKLDNKMSPAWFINRANCSRFLSEGTTMAPVMKGVVWALCGHLDRLDNWINECLAWNTELSQTDLLEAASFLREFSLTHKW